jgi:tRNA threonylcarbamoyladenosine biosynthesis protein TsaB
MIDARRMEVYTQVFDSKANPLSSVTAEVVDENTLAEHRAATDHFVVFGSGAAKCAEILGAELIDVTPSVRGMATIAEQKFADGNFADVAYFEPYYLKDFVVTTSKKKLF